MQTMAVQIQDNYVQNFMSYVNEHSSNITVSKDKNLELDPYFMRDKNNYNKILKILIIVKQKCYHQNNLILKWIFFLKT